MDLFSFCDVYKKLTDFTEYKLPSSESNERHNTMLDNDIATVNSKNEDRVRNIAHAQATHHVPASAGAPLQHTKHTESFDERHKRKFDDAVTAIKSETGRKITVKSNKQKMTCTIIAEHLLLQKQPTRTTNTLDIRELSVQKSIEEPPLPLATLFLRLSFRNGEWERALVSMNKKIAEHNSVLKQNYRDGSTFGAGLVKEFTKREFLIGMALIIGASDYSDKGEGLWSKNSTKGKQEEERHWETICEKNDFGKYMKLYRFKNFRTFFRNCGKKISTNPLIRGGSFQEQ